MCFSRISLNSSLNLSLNTLTIKSGRSVAYWSTKRPHIISSQSGLHVKVMNNSGLPNFLTIVNICLGALV